MSAMSGAERQKRYRERHQTSRNAVVCMLLEVKRELASLRDIVTELVASRNDSRAREYMTLPSSTEIPDQNPESRIPVIGRLREDAKLNHKGATNDRAKPRRRLSPDWQPSSEDRAVAIECGLDPDAVADEFRDYWIGRGEPMADWSRTYRGWCRRQFKRATAINGHKLSAVDKLFLGAARAADAVEARFRAREQVDASLLDR